MVLFIRHGPTYVECTISQWKYEERAFVEAGQMGNKRQLRAKALLTFVITHIALQTLLCGICFN